MDITAFKEYDKKHIWHPYTSAINPMDSLLVKNAKGATINLEDGTSLIDGMSSWWSAIHGYNNPVLNKALSDQAAEMSHIMFGGLTHKPAIKLAQELLKIVPNGLEHIFYCDSGSVSVEIAMKMALQYWQGRKLSKKNNFVTIKNGYHGDTWHAMSVCDPITGMHHIFNGKLSVQHFLPSPDSVFDGSFDANEIIFVDKFLKQESKNIAAFILEPIVQGAGGMRFYHPSYLKGIRELCDKYNILLIADEIATGFGRSGKLFACEYASVSPDIMCLGKAITGGYMSFAATLCSSEVANGISESESGVFMHGPTFMGNPLACTLAIESIKLLLSSDWEQNIKRIELKLKSDLYALINLQAVKDVRVLGAIGVVELNEAVNMKNIQQEFLRNKIWMRPFGKLVYTMPPYIINNDELNILTKGICNTISKIYGN